MTKEDFLKEIESFAASDAVEQLLDNMIDLYTNAWRGTTHAQGEHREHLFRMVTAVEALKNEIRSVAMNERVTIHNSRSRGKQV
ncbi:hypothetical protein UFOVP1339_48 [uncultured Caudovirales phage]|uniref:Uncharacterized protein n=1 Tax=uncultured Caudovirales phage TaxID=2100421 RepID=A0A6J5RX57_9CAUD|nr:hypothetical protein UFOVP1339_48 [uncultured Caudovirales phage]